jgi:hypothetical protein
VDLLDDATTNRMRDEVANLAFSEDMVGEKHPMFDHMISNYRTGLNKNKAVV